MNPYSNLLRCLRAAARDGMPTRIVATNYVAHANREIHDLYAGVVTFLLQQSAIGEWANTLTLTVVGQVAVNERERDQIDTEGAELALFNEFLAWSRNPGPRVPPLTIEGAAQFSAQLDHPYGWWALRLRVGPFELIDYGDDLYPPTVNDPGPYTGADVDIDVDPHEPNAEHRKWLRGNYSSSAPDLQTRIDTEQQP